MTHIYGLHVSTTSRAGRSSFAGAKKSDAPKRARFPSVVLFQMTNIQLAISITTTPATSVR